MAWEAAKAEMKKLEKRRLALLKAEIKRRNHYIKTGEWKYEKENSTKRN